MYYSESEIVSFVRDGADPGERITIAAQMNCCSEAEIVHILNRHGMRVSPVQRKAGRKPALTPGKYQQMKEAIVQGLSFSEIAGLLGVNHGSVLYHARKIRAEKEKAPK